MATPAPLMPKATAVWLLDNTALTFDQIAEFCKLHPLEIKAIADGDAAQGIKGLDPIQTGQLTREQITAAEADHEHLAQADRAEGLGAEPERGGKKGPRYTPVSRRQDRPNAILWLVRNHPELKDSAIMRLVGTTKSTISAIRDRTHWNAAALAPMDPVTLGLATQTDLDFEVNRANKEKPAPVDTGATLLPAAETTARKEAEVAAAAAEAEKKPGGSDLNVSAVFAKLKQLGGKSEKEERVRRAFVLRAHAASDPRPWESAVERSEPGDVLTIARHDPSSAHARIAPRCRPLTAETESAIAARSTEFIIPPLPLHRRDIARNGFFQHRLGVLGDDAVEIMAVERRRTKTAPSPGRYAPTSRADSGMKFG